jgi:catechol 2,3-dioxygenase-like lactoylglutathione lyase family enzyme
MPSVGHLGRTEKTLEEDRMIRVRKIAHATYEMPDLDPQIEYYTEVLGLNLVGKEKNAAYLASKIEHHSVVLRKGSEPKCTRLGFEIGVNEDLGAFEKQVQAHGVKTQRKKDPEPTITDMVTFEDAKGTVMEVFQRGELTQKSFPEKGVVPHKLGHVAFHCEDVKKVTKFYVDVLGFRESDWMADFFSFLRCGPDHHTINLMGTGSNRHFHTAFELRDWSHMESACDFLSRKGYRQIWGPGRHGIGHNLFCYHRSPAGFITELFAELDLMLDEELGHFAPRPWHRDNPQKPKVWAKDPGASNLWGVGPPEDMMK